MLHVGKWVQETGGFIVLMCSNRDKGSETNINFVQTNKEDRGIFTLKLRNSHFDLFNKGENWRAVPCRCHVCSPNSCPFRLRSSSLLRNCCFNQFPKKPQHILYVMGGTRNILTLQLIFLNRDFCFLHLNWSSRGNAEITTEKIALYVLFMQ